MLAVVTSSGPKSIHIDAESEALDAAKQIRRKVVSMPIRVVAQSDNRNRTTYNNLSVVDGKVLIFYGSDINASTHLVDRNNSEMLETKFEDWKKKLLFFNTHQVIAFHFTVVNGTEPEDSEEIFR
ncbi:hypothetical protein LOAG_09708 [Loa loa]|uniref:Pyrid_ox_like domain-containing protein n=1 Tax=Loa loa TaxID=7209 RepID=A0A1I7W5A4_LOALO|nr:hypothetical protein LOAG_09708 [Loa loa]EFO18787.1 hypothetical protein LOAG_09708 [Loa loa]